MPLVRDLPVVDHDSITIRPVRDVGHDIDRETLIQKMMEKSGCSREEIERFLATAGAWADDDETVLTIMRVREEMARWQPPEW